MTPTEILQQINKLSDKDIYVLPYREGIGSDEWIFGYRVEYLPKEAQDLKRRATSFVTVDSLKFSGGATYFGGYDTIEQALIEGIKYAQEKLVPLT
jgi:hypothetical protein